MNNHLKLIISDVLNIFFRNGWAFPDDHHDNDDGSADDYNDDDDDDHVDNSETQEDDHPTANHG